MFTEYTKEEMEALESRLNAEGGDSENFEAANLALEEVSLFEAEELIPDTLIGRTYTESPYNMEGESLW